MPEIRRVRRYEDVVLATKPVFYVPLQGNSLKELVRVVAVTNNNSVGRSAGPFPGHAGSSFSTSTADNDSLTVATNAAYHPGDTFSAGGWFNRTGAGDGTGSAMLHMGANDFLVWLTSDVVTIRKAGVGNVISGTTTFGAPYTKGWHHCIVTKTAGSSAQVYVDGVSEGGAFTNQTIVAAAVDPTLGLAAGGTTNDWEGSLSHWAVWNRVITQAEVTELYRSGRNAI